ncbi:torsin-1A-like [Scomber japonicus]|uniref:torsin-1A-like n=1 Tax=Scomber japonicus TaxID=13676 RepID=UPI0023053610|nr:torsin-1A-like [Scomber japonicus]
MKAVQTYLLLYVFLMTSVLVNTFDPKFIFDRIADKLRKLWQIFKGQESCDSDWISFNSAGLQADLESKLFGQHIAFNIILKAVNGFMSKENPQKPLVLSLHGPTGTGKSFASTLIADNIYKEGINSRFVHVFISTLHFPHVHQIDTYKSQLKQWIKGNVTNCPRSMFIFDEMDKMPPSLIDSVKSFLDYYKKLDGVSYRKTIFIFLSNTEGHSITETALDFWRAGRDREDIELKDLETSVSASAFNNKGSGLWHSSLIEQNMVDFFIPFLPLEFKHVVQCVMAQMEVEGLEPNQHVAYKVARDLEYFPKFEKVFSVSGCKKITSRLHFYKEE